MLDIVIRIDISGWWFYLLLPLLLLLALILMDGDDTLVCFLLMVWRELWALLLSAPFKLLSVITVKPVYKSVSNYVSIFFFIWILMLLFNLSHITELLSSNQSIINLISLYCWSIIIHKNGLFGESIDLIDSNCVFWKKEKISTLNICFIHTIYRRAIKKACL